MSLVSSINSSDARDLRGPFFIPALKKMKTTISLPTSSDQCSISFRKLFPIYVNTFSVNNNNNYSYSNNIVNSNRGSSITTISANRPDTFRAINSNINNSNFPTIYNTEINTKIIDNINNNA